MFFHKAFGHPSETAMRATAKHCGWKSTGKFKACEACQRSNVQQKMIKKTTDDQETKPGERLFADMSSVSEHTSLGGAKVWLCVVDDATGHCWNCTMKSKAEAPKRLLTLIKSSNDRGHPVKKIRLDDASELRKLARLAKESDDKFHRIIQFEFTARDTPQFNGKVERKIASMTRKVRLTLNAARLTK